VSKLDVCCICGGIGPFGFDVNLRQGREGFWACAAHRDQVARERGMVLR
jgi:hypothetical protein